MGRAIAALMVHDMASVFAGDVDGDRYLVSMLGERVNWIRNVRAAGGRAAIRRGALQQVRLEEVGEQDRPPIIKTHLAKAPNARIHISVNASAPLSEFGPVSDRIPVFRVVPLTVS